MDGISRWRWGGVLMDDEWVGAGLGDSHVAALECAMSEHTNKGFSVLITAFTYFPPVRCRD